MIIWATKQETLKNSVTKEERNKSNKPPNLALQLNITGSADYVLLKVLGERRFNAGPLKPLQRKTFILRIEALLSHMLFDKNSPIIRLERIFSNTKNVDFIVRFSSLN